MKKLDLKTLALPCLALGLLMSGPASASLSQEGTSFSYSQDEDDEDDVLLAGGGCGGKGHCGGQNAPSDKQDPMIDQTNPQNSRRVPPNTTPQYDEENQNPPGHGCNSQRLVRRQKAKIPPSKRIHLV